MAMTNVVAPEPETVSSQDEDAVLRKIVGDYKWAANYRSSYKKDWDRYYRLYKSRIARPSDPYPFESNVFIPYIFSVIETQLPMIMQQIFANGQFVDVHGRRIDDQLNAPIVHDILKYQFERNIKVHNLCYSWAKQALIYGTSPALIDWDYKQLPVKVRVPTLNLDGQIVSSKTVEAKRTIANNPIAKVIDISSYFQCPTTPESPCTSNNVLFAGWEFALTWDELNADAETGLYNKEKVRSLTAGTAQLNAGYQHLEDRAIILGKQGPMGSMIDTTVRNQIPCIKYFGKFNVDGKFRYKVATVAFPGGYPGFGAEGQAGVGVLIQFQDCPFHFTRIPISLCRVNLLEGELYGMGDIEVIESLQTELTDQRNQRNDIIVRGMNPMFTKLRGSTIDESQLIYRPMGMVEVDTHDDIKPLITDQSTLQNAFTEERVIKQDIQFASGVSDFIVGQFQNSSGFNDTATGISLIQAAAQGRIVLKAQFLQVAIKDLCEVVWALDQQFLPYDTVMKVLDPLSASKYNYIRASPDVINGQYDFTVVNAPATGNPQLRQNQLIQVLGVAVQIMAQAQAQNKPININYSNLMKRIFQEFNVPNIAEILPDVGELALINQIPEPMDAAMAEGSELDPETEDQMLLSGTKDLPVHYGDDDVSHILEHQNAALQASEPVKIEINKHISKHSIQLQKKRQMLMQGTMDTAAQLAVAQANANPGINGTVEAGLANPNPSGSSSPNDAGGAESQVRAGANAAAGNA